MPTTPIEAALCAVGAATGLHTADPRPLRLHDAAIFLLDRDQVVVRLLTATAVHAARAATAVEVTGWLATQNFPAVRPAWPAPIYIEGYVATLWHYLPQPESRRRPPDIVLGRLVRDLHRLPAPPFLLPKADPLARLRQAVDLDRTRTTPALTEHQRAFCERRIVDLTAAYATLDTPLGEGLIHNDAHSGNLLTAPTARTVTCSATGTVRATDHERST
jgi:aminoglycoside phosphotransferase (APT) family kinase protein